MHHSWELLHAWREIDQYYLTRMNLLLVPAPFHFSKRRANFGRKTVLMLSVCGPITKPQGESV